MLKKIIGMQVYRKLSFWLVLGMLGLFSFWLSKTLFTPSNTVPSGGMPAGFEMPVEAVPVSCETIYDDLVTVGSLKANEFVMIRPEMEGRIAKIYFQEGQYIKEGEPLISLDDQIATAGLEESKAHLNLSEAQSQRQTSLYRHKYVSSGEKDKAASKLQADQAILNRKKRELEKTKIYAPFDGFLGLIKVSPGDYVKPGQDIVPLASLNPLKVEFSVAELYVPYVHVGQRINITTESLPGKIFQGEIYALDPMVDEAGRNIKIKGRLSNQDFTLKPGMFVRLKIQLAERAKALLIPEEAIVFQDQKHFIYKIDAGRAKKVFVKMGARTEGKVEILEGVSAQDRIITAGQIKIRDGMPVKIIPSSDVPVSESKTL